MALAVAERIAQISEHFAKHDAHGYSQVHRGDGGTETITLSDGSQVRISASDLDCSEMVRQCVNGALTGNFQSPIDWMYTGNEDSILRGLGFQKIAFSAGAVVRGDILLRSGHTGVGIGNGQQSEAAIDEVGGITGPSRGDQTGREVRIATLNNWNYIYRYPEAKKQDPVQKPGDPYNNNGMTYRAHIEYKGWLDPVHDGQVAGTTGFGTKMEAIKITPPEGLVLDAIAHVQDVGSLAYEDIKKGTSSGTNSSDNDPIIGSTGKGKRLEAVTLHVKENTTGKILKYQGHIQDIGWGPVCVAGQRCGTKGQSKRLEAIRIWLA